ncbi:hypothetical protein KL933_004330 [Ogataea haglerorum]|uniref:Peptidase M20 dimerisation domain-containing protein n=1 Tax=Ogataea haglerorum TaxID=1937702 RepID=A0AAN6HZ14_9ASCO|nr:hypothetical protein KL950_004763 [Ogataea haglerorum]KAG7725316.1 hypothetical protein KL933_004330 [Ogataea haglerorum]KAG7727387.1 hypothetical protein KL948_004536 [Ogataea haglerorum]KAG7762490.1 hypothetical protein KL946_004606 [Ogataea haglerorum]KAG7784383.1 hypothetical protein KL945_004396 [Ogataea haglerorum]
MRLAVLFYLILTAASLPFFDIRPQLSLPNTLHSSVAKTDALGLYPLHKRLVRIKSLSFQEQDASEYVAEYLERLGLTVERISSQGRNNIYAYLGKTRDTKVLLTSHIDTVPPYIGYYDNGDKIYGRGSCDAKGSVAAQITAFTELYEQNEVHEGDVALLFVVGEETGGDGMLTVDKEIDANWKMVVFGEPTENKLAVGHKGVYYFKIQVHGLSSHSGYPELGKDANEELIRIMYDISTTEWPSDEILGATTVNIGLINAGTAANVVSPIAECEVLMRVSVQSDAIQKKVADILGKYRDVELNVIQKADPTYLDHDVPGFDTMLAAYFTDVPNLTQRGFKRYLYGPGSILVAHGDNEYVTHESLEAAVEGYKKLVAYGLK